MAAQIHKKFTNEQVKELLQKYLNKEVERRHIQEILGIGKSRFFEIIQSYRNNPQGFSVDYKRSAEAKRIAPEIQDNIIKELAIYQKAIGNKDIPLYRYNYSDVQKRLKKQHKQSAALEAKKSLFRSWSIPMPFVSPRDIFALRCQRFVDNYHSVTIKNIHIKLPDVEPRYPVDIRIDILDQDFYELRFWYKAKLIKIIRHKIEDFLPVHF